MLLLGLGVLGALQVARQVEQIAELAGVYSWTVSSERLRRLKLIMFS
jgi:hypothetical protein